MEDSAIAESPTPPLAGPSIPRRNLDQVFRHFNAEGFDWKAFEGTYQGRALITRLLHIPKILLSRPATTDPNLLLFARTALLRAIPHIKQTWDYNLYYRVMSQINETLGKSSGKIPMKDSDSADGEEDEPMADSVGDLRGNEAEGELDMVWVSSVKEEEKKEVTRTDVELRGYMSNLIKESIRLTHLSFARMAVRSGKFTDVLKHHASAREFSSSPMHHVEQGLSVIDACLLFNHPLPLSGMLNKVETAVDRVYPVTASASRPNTTSAAGAVTADDVREHRERDTKAADARKEASKTLRVAKGLLALSQAHFRKAGEEYAELLEEGGLGLKEGEAISTSDIALIAGICVLATGSRNTIRDVLLSRSSFRSSVDDTHQWLLDAIRLFSDAQYGETMTVLEKAKPTLILNPFLSSHVDVLLAAINTRAIIQYIQPFSTVSLPAMSTATGVPETSLLAQIEDLIEQEKVKGKIDLIDMVLHIRDADPRADAYTSASRVGSKINSSTRAAIIRMRLQEAKIEVNARAPTKDKGVKSTDSIEIDTEEQEELLPYDTPVAA